MSCNVLLHDCTRHTRTLSLLTYLEDLLGISSFIEAVIGTDECALGERS
jgi:hypothetical protein